MALCSGLGAHGLAHAATALSAGLLARAMAGGPTAVTASRVHTTWDWSLPLILKVGLGATAVKAVASTFVAAGEVRLASTVGQRVRERALTHLLRAGSRAGSPRLLAAMMLRVREVEAAVILGTLGQIRALAQLVPIGVTLFALSAPLALGAVCVLAPFGLVSAGLRGRWKRSAAAAQRVVEQLQEGTDDLVRHLDLWRTYGAGAKVTRSVADLAHRAEHHAARVESFRAGLSSLNEVLVAAALLGAAAGCEALGIPIGNPRLLPFLAVALMAYRPVRELGDSRAARTRGAVALEGLEELLVSSLEDPRPRLVHPGRPRADTQGSSEPGLAAVTLRDFGASDRGPRVCAQIPAGALVCIVGPTGCGKTTLLRALLGLEGTVGEVCHAGRSLRDGLDSPDQRPFAWVPQDAPLISGTLAENVDLLHGDPDATRRALTRLGAGDLMDQCGNALLGPGGRELSGGERRLVSLARALASDRPVLLLDEPTEGLDAHSAGRVLAALSALRGTRTVLVVTHQPEPQRLADQIWRLDDQTAPLAPKTSAGAPDAAPQRPPPALRTVR